MPRLPSKRVYYKGYFNLKGRPEFFCRCCDHYWTYGNDGGPYYDIAIKYMEKCGMEMPPKPRMTVDGYNQDFIDKYS